MIKSMTGFGKSNCEYNNRKYSIEIKSLNSKQSDIYARIPVLFKEKEILLRNFISANLVRGKIEISIRMENDASDKVNIINKELFADYLIQLKSMSGKAELDIDDNNLFRTVMRMPDILKPAVEAFDELEWNAVFKEIKEAVKHLDEYRIQEGAAIGSDILFRVKKIGELLSEIPAFETERIKIIRERLLKNLGEFNKVENIDENRLEQELIYYLEKLDITEEKVRLVNHLDYFNKTAEENESSGKKLGFISQELGREINTIGSKASHVEIQKIVVQMKDELEKIKEQLMNVL